MDIRDFATDFMDNVKTAVEMDGKVFVEELTEEIIDYIIDNGDVEAPEICLYSRPRARIVAYDLNTENKTLDLFSLITTDTILGKISNEKVNDAVSKIYHFYKEVLNGTLKKTDDEVREEVAELSDLIISTKGQIKTLRHFILTNGLTDYCPDNVTSSEFQDLELEYVVWDMQRLYQQHCILAGKEKIEIDLPAVYDAELQCLKMSPNSTNVDCYLAIMPGITLAKIYNTYKQALLETNVRTFLSFKTSINKGIRETITDEPEMFFAYNNGISATASHVEVKEGEGGDKYITKISDLQIVNGGQTTASIAANFNRRGVDLTKIFVPMKISVIPDKDKITQIVPLISKYANKQNAIKDDDLDSGHNFFISFERFSREVWVPNGNMRSTTKWYFERTRGQYLNEQSYQTGINLRNFKTEYPKNHKFVKTDIARVEVCSSLMPEIACKGAQNVHKHFKKEIDKIAVDETFYKQTIAKLILYSEIDMLVKQQQLGGYKSNMNNYLFASVILLSHKKLNLSKIWAEQKISQQLKDYITNLIHIVWSHLIDDAPDNAKDSQTWSKKTDCWVSLKNKLQAVDPVPDSELANDRDSSDDTLNDAQRATIEKAWEISSNTWFAIYNFCRQNGILAPLQRRMTHNFGIMKQRGTRLSFYQASAGLQILQEVKEAGFNE